MNIPVNKYSKFHRWPYDAIPLMIISIIIMSVIWQFLLSDVTIRKRQVIENDAGKEFVSQFDSVKSIAVSRDTASESTGEEYDSVEIRIVSLDTDEVIWSEKIEKDDIEDNSFSEIELADSIKLKKGKSYNITYSGDEEGQDETTYSLMLYGDSVSIYSYYSIICILSVAFLIIYLYWKEKTKGHFTLWFVVAFLSLAMLNTLVLKPLSVPDEETHFGKAYYLSNAMLGLSGESERNVTESGITRGFGGVGLEDSVFFYTNTDYGNEQSARRTTWLDGGSNLSDLPYVFGAIGISIGRILSLPYQWIVILGRLLNILFLLAMDVIAIRIYPKMKYIVAGVCLVPGMAWELASYSYDVWNIAWVLVFVSLCFRVREQEAGVRAKDLAALAFALIMFAPIKGIYVLIGLTIFVIPKAQWKDKRLIWGCVGGIVAVMVTVVIARGREILEMLTSSTMDPRGIVDESAGSYTLGYIVRNPVKVLMTFIKTFITTTGEFLYKSIGGEFYSKYVPSAIVAIGLLIVLLLICTAASDILVQRRDRIISAIIVFLGCLAVYGSFLFIFSQIPSEGVGTIGGMQARYFIPFMILLPIALRSNRLQGLCNRMVDSFIGSSMDINGHGIHEILLGDLFVINIIIVFCKWIGIALA